MVFYVDSSIGNKSYVREFQMKLLISIVANLTLKQVFGYRTFKVKILILSVSDGELSVQSTRDPPSTLPGLSPWTHARAPPLHPVKWKPIPLRSNDRNIKGKREKKGRRRPYQRYKRTVVTNRAV